MGCFPLLGELLNLFSPLPRNTLSIFSDLVVLMIVQYIFGEFPDVLGEMKWTLNKECFSFMPGKSSSPQTEKHSLDKALCCNASELTFTAGTLKVQVLCLEEAVLPKCSSCSSFLTLC